MKIQTLFTLLLFVTLGFQHSVAQDEQTHYGEKITTEGAVNFSNFYDQMKDKEELDIKVRGMVNEVCQAKGCWITLTEGEKEVFVKFKDYAFFMPKDISGREVVIEGTAFREVVSVEELRHMAMDAGKGEKLISKITEPKEELRFMAHGVILLPEE